MSFSACQGRPNTALPLRGAVLLGGAETALRLAIRWRGPFGLHLPEQIRSHGRTGAGAAKCLIGLWFHVASGSGRVAGGPPPFDSEGSPAPAPNCYRPEKWEAPQGGAGGAYAR